MNNKRLIELCCQGDKQALGILYQKYYNKMIRVCLFYVADRQIAQDLIHDSFIIIFTSIGSLQDPNKLDRWIRTIVKNICLKYINQRNTSNIISLSELEKNEEPLDEIQPKDLPSYTDLIKLVEQLPEGYQKIFKLSVVEGMSHKEISSLLGIATHSSSSQLFRAKEMLKKLITQYGLLILIMIILPLSIWFILNNKTLKEAEYTEMAKEDNSSMKTVNDSVKHSYPSNPPRQTPIASVLDTTRHSSTSEDTITVSHSFQNLKEEQSKDTAKKEKTKRRYNTSVIPTLKNKSYWNVSISYSGGKSYNKMKHSTIPGDISSGAPEEIKIEEKVYHYTPITLSVALHKSINERWGIETGIRYTLLKSKFTTQREYYTEKMQYINYLGIPLKGTFQLWKRGNMSIYSSTGTILEVPIKAITKETIIENNKITVQKENSDLPLQWSIDVSAGFQYQITPSVGIYAEPSLHYYFNPKGSPNTIRTQRPLDISLPIGIRFSW